MQRMRGNIMDEIKDSFKQGSMLTKLIYINLGVFIVVRFIGSFYSLFVAEGSGLTFKGDILPYLMLPSNIETLLFRFWTPITYMFLHFAFLHILFNLLTLFWFGRIFLQYLNPKQMLSTYLLGGLMGALFFVISYNLFPGLATNGIVMGASASVMAIVIAIAVYAPNQEIHLVFLGRVKLKVLAIVFVVLDLIMIDSNNAGGHIAHLGGAFYGALFAMQLRKGRDAGRGFERIMDAFSTLFKRRSKLKVTYKNKAKVMTDMEYNQSKAASQKEVDKILDKIAKSGYDSLSKSEKEILFKMSNKN